MLRLLRALRDDDRGVSLLLVAAAMTALLGVAAIALDISLAMSERRVDQTAADMGVTATAQDAYLGLGPMQATALEYTEINLPPDGNVGLSACDDSPPSGLTWYVVDDCLAVAASDSPGPLGTARVGQVWLGLPDQGSGPVFGGVAGLGEIQTRASAAAALNPRGRLAPVAVRGTGPLIACMTQGLPPVVPNPDCSGSFLPLALVDSPGCVSGGGFAANLANGIDHLIMQWDGGTVLADNCANPANQLSMLGDDLTAFVDTLVAPGGPLADPSSPPFFINPQGLDAFIPGCAWVEEPGDMDACLQGLGSGAVGSAILESSRFLYVPVVDGSNLVTDFAGFYLDGLYWQSVLPVEYSDILGLGSVVVRFNPLAAGVPAAKGTCALPDPLVLTTDPILAPLLDPIFDELLVELTPWLDGSMDPCLGPDGLIETLNIEVRDLVNTALEPIGLELPEITPQQSQQILSAGSAAATPLQVSGFVIPSVAMPEVATTPAGPQVNPYIVENLTR